MQTKLALLHLVSPGIHEKKNQQNNSIFSICWEQTSYAKVTTHQFERTEKRVCGAIVPAKATAVIRTFQDYQLRDGTLLVFTQYKNPDNPAKYDNAVVHLNAFELGTGSWDKSEDTRLRASYRFESEP